MIESVYFRNTNLGFVLKGTRLFITILEIEINQALLNVDK